MWSEEVNTCRSAAICRADNPVRRLLSERRREETLQGRIPQETSEEKYLQETSEEKSLLETSEETLWSVIGYGDKSEAFIVKE
ncbi:Dynein-1-beta heavy chain flagellar inner arm I1 complex [Dissostichus eleginoides]|uniref:Dynein-1-beta heavy chain flagellar inner arm I1 complex n=1 Tax=Dissostichus eleginoides TaxID=100907 RepID=A0AAD9B431_DISEL|nr:Dynein-1-beta heavy chain flagellar inner arm I1 complex [Dissostichus eleginoides]KAK1876326.1 Dynein-1-beta heavy chain flagellar inner arm I1 complex [Dissostichus eleginoides]